ncbi:MAG: hypothetical protein N2C14_16985, partial [Planctomycetales bacterium]
VPAANPFGQQPPAAGQQGFPPPPGGAPAAPGDPFAGPPPADNPFGQPAPDTGNPFGQAPVTTICHIVCPCDQKQILPTPGEMIGQDGQCPHCGDVFRLRREDSLEYQKEREEHFRLKEERLSKKWLNWAIAISIIVGIGVLTLIVIVAAG